MYDNSITVCMYGAASDNIDDLYIRQVYGLGRGIALRGWKLIYGGGASGLMGAVARGVKDGGGFVIGVVPTWMDQREPIFASDTVIKTDNMADRKKIMEDNADAFIICPGGIGTFDEFFQTLTLKDLNRHRKPIILYNIDDYYTELVDFINNCTTKGFIRDYVPGMMGCSASADEILDMIAKEIELKNNALNMLRADEPVQ